MSDGGAPKRRGAREYFLLPLSTGLNEHWPVYTTAALRSQRATQRSAAVSETGLYVTPLALRHCRRHRHHHHHQQQQQQQQY